MSIKCYERLCLYYSKHTSNCSLDECIIYCKHCGESLTNSEECENCGRET